jgi:DNA-binding LytR/AlgR family response regulator
MHRYNCIIVEDEPLAAEVVKDYIEQVPFLQLKGICTDALYAMDLLQKEKIDLVFLDIHLPKLKGFDFIRALKKPPQIIITSAYQEYALQGYELNVLDYLLKPIEFNRFVMAVNKLKEREITDVLPVSRARVAERAALFFNVSKKRVKVYIDEILFIESLKEYIRITTKEKSILTKYQLGQIEEMLAKNGFLRVHRSFLVAKNKIDAFSATDVEVNGEQIPIGRSYKDIVMSVLEN